MAFKQFVIEGIGELKVYKRRGARSLRLSVQHDGSVRLTIPTWTPYAVGVEFARSRTQWIKDNARPVAASLYEGQLIGKSHRLHFVATMASQKPTSRVKPTEIIVSHSSVLSPNDQAVQKIALQACIRALRAESKRLLAIRLAELAQKHGFSYKSVGVKQLKSRWGSCDQDKNIILNLFLMLLPWELIDYVLLHELTHTRVMKHGPEFWQAMAAVEPRTPQLRKAIRSQKPNL